MSFTDEVMANQTRTGGTCTAGLWRAEFGKKDPAGAKEFDRLMADPQVQSQAIWAAMRARGYTASSQGLTRHRRGNCQCPSPTT